VLAASSAATVLALQVGVWKARFKAKLRRAQRPPQDNDVSDFDLNVLPPILPSRLPAGHSQTASRRVWRKIVYWARRHDRAKHGTVDRLAGVGTEGGVLDKIVVYGGGAFGTALGTHLARKGYAVHMVVRRPEVRDFINRKHINPMYFPEFDLPPSLQATCDPTEALNGCTTFVHALPVQISRKVLGEIRHSLPRNIPVVAASKGVEMNSRMLMADLIPEALGRDNGENPVVIVSGPSFALEIMDKRPTSVVAASQDPVAGERIQRLFTSHYCRVSLTDDMIGVEIAGALKNVLAIAAGICEGLGLGLNAMSALVTQGNAEIRWLATAMGARPETVAGLAGMGDILLTCFGNLSRNRTVGVRIGQGMTVEQALAGGGGTSEGVFTARLVVELAEQHRVIMPVLTSVARVLNEEASPRQAVYEVMSLPTMEESA